MYEWFTTDFNIFGLYLGRFLRVNIQDGTFFKILILIGISIFLLKKLWDFKIIQFGYKLCKNSINIIIKIFKLIIKLTLNTYLKLKNILGSYGVTISYPRCFLKISKYFKSIVFKSYKRILK